MHSVGVYRRRRLRSSGDARRRPYPVVGQRWDVPAEQAIGRSAAAFLNESYLSRYCPGGLGLASSRLQAGSAEPFAASTSARAHWGPFVMAAS